MSIDNMDSTDSASDTTLQDSTTSKCTAKILAQGPWNESLDPLSLTGAPSLPMPVKIAEPISLAPFFQHLKNNGTHQSHDDDGSFGHEPYYNTDMIEFERGVLYADGRIDLCKMVTGPPNIGALMDSLRTNTFAKHFLLGNNIIGPTGAKAIAAFIEDFPYQFETWYLAGNCIDAPSFSLLVDAMVKSTSITNVWLKRNPLGPTAAKDVFRLITQTTSLRTLDLDQTELGDAGVAELFSLLAQHERPLPLRHIYLNATGISKSACAQISQYLSSPHCALESLYLSTNPIGDSGAKALAPGLPNCPSLQRLVLESCGLKDPGAIALLSSLPTNLRALNLGQAYATADLNMRYNWLTDACTSSLTHLIHNSPGLQYLNISYQPLTQSSLTTLLSAVLSSPSLLVFEAKPLIKGGHSYEEVKAGQMWCRLSKQAREHLHRNVAEQFDGMGYEEFHSGPKRFLTSPTDVRFIDSVYRNRDAGLRRRGIKALEKHWAEGDETLMRVAEGV